MPGGEILRSLEGVSPDWGSAVLGMLSLFAATASFTVPSATAPPNAFNLLRGIDVLRATDGVAVPLTEQWATDERAVLVLMRSFG